jgi:hypothetical protein
MKFAAILTLAFALPSQETTKFGTIKVQSDRDTEPIPRRCVVSGGYSEMEDCQRYHRRCKPAISCYTNEIVWIPSDTIIIRP